MSTAWREAGHDVEAIVGQTGKDSVEQSINGVRLRRVGPRSHPGALDRFPTILRAHLAAGPLGKLRRTVARFSEGWEWPDTSRSWSRAAERAAVDVVSDGGFDAVVTVSDPFSTHRVGLAVHARKPRLRWVADVGDPFSLLTRVPRNNHALYDEWNKRLEAEVFDTASAVSFTTEETAQAYSSFSPALSSKSRVIPPLIPAVPAVPGKPPFGDDGLKHLLFVGTLDRTVRNPEALLRLFAALRQREGGEALRLHIVGRPSDSAGIIRGYASSLGGALHLHGELPRPVVYSALRKADVLVNIGFDEIPLQLPSKVVEYADAARPVLNLTSRASDCSERYFAKHPASLTLRIAGGRPSPEAIEKAAAFIAAPPPCTGVALEALLVPSRLPAIAAAYLSLISAGGEPR